MLFYCDNLNEISKQEYELLLSFLPFHRKCKALKYLKVEDRITSIISYILLIYLSDYMGIPFHDMEVHTNQYGKPFFYNSELGFSLSHTYNAVACIIEKGSVGVDIQVNIAEYESVIDRICTSAEKEYVKLSPFPTMTFTRLWTIKESYVKCIGTGIWDGIDKLDFSDMKSPQKRYGFYFNCFCEDQYVISVCSTMKSIEKKKIDLAEIIDYVARSESSGRIYIK